MEDKAKEISGKIWKWYKKAIGIDKGQQEWETLLGEAEMIVGEYKNDELNYGLAADLFFAFEAHAERLEKRSEQQ